MAYTPRPINTKKVKLSEELLNLTEQLAKNTHAVWAKQRLAEGWTCGPKRNDKTKQHPCLIPYKDLPDSEKEYDRNTSMETLKAIVALGYKLIKGSKKVAGDNPFV